jgi:hypothetical protein
VGCGKTFLFFLAVEEVQKKCRDGSKNFGYFYCTSHGADTSGKSIAVVFKTLLQQLCPRPKVPRAIQSLYDICDEGRLDHRSPTVHELAGTLVDIITPSNPSLIPAPDLQDYYLLIDGLDELEPPSRDELLKELRPIVFQNFPNIHVLLTSRNDKEIEESLQQGVVWYSLPVDTESVQADIRIFVRSEIQSHPQLRGLPRNTQDTILDMVIQQSGGM